MTALETRLIISAVDETAKAFASVEHRIKGLTGAAAMASRSVGSVPGQVGAATAARRAIGETSSRMSMVAGAASAAAGLAVAYGGAVAVREAAKAVGARQHELVRMAVSGMKSGEIAEATSHASALAAKMPNISATETLHMLRNARSIVGSYEEAAAIAEPMMKLRTLAQLARPGQDVSEDFDQLIKGLEIKGVTQNPEQFRQYMEGIAKGINVFGDTLKPYQYYEMFKYGRQATSGLSEKFILGTAPTLAQELGGSSYGKAVSAFNAMIVGGIGKKGAFEELARLKLIEGGNGALTGAVGTDDKQLKKGRTVKGWQVAQADPNQWVREYLLPALDKAGIRDRENILRELSTLFQNQTANQMVGLLATQQSRIDKDLALLRGAPGLEAVDKAMRADPSLAFDALKNSAEGVVASFGTMIGAGKGFADWATTAAEALATAAHKFDIAGTDQGRKEGDASIRSTNEAIGRFAERERDRNYRIQLERTKREAKVIDDSLQNPNLTPDQRERLQNRYHAIVGEAVDRRDRWLGDIHDRAGPQTDAAIAREWANRGEVYGPTQPGRTRTYDFMPHPGFAGAVETAARQEAEVRVFGEVTGEVKGEAQVTATVDIAPGARDMLVAAHAAAEQSMRLVGQMNGRIDGDAGPRRSTVPLTAAIPRGGH